MKKETRRNYIKVIMGERLYLHDHGMHFILFFKCGSVIFTMEKKCSGLVTLVER